MENTSISLGNFQSVKDYAIIKGITVQAVYDRIKAEKLEVRKIGSFTLVKDK